MKAKQREAGEKKSAENGTKARNTIYLMKYFVLFYFLFFATAVPFLGALARMKMRSSRCVQINVHRTKLLSGKIDYYDELWLWPLISNCK